VVWYNLFMEPQNIDPGISQITKTKEFKKPNTILVFIVILLLLLLSIGIYFVFFHKIKNNTYMPNGTFVLKDITLTPPKEDPLCDDVFSGKNSSDELADKCFALMIEITDYENLNATKMFNYVPVKRDLNDQIVATVQKFLKDNGYYKGEINGNYDDLTQVSIEQYRFLSGTSVLPLTPGLNSKLLYDIARRIRPLEAKEIIVLSPLPGAKVESGKEIILEIGYGPLVKSLKIDSPGFDSEYRDYIYNIENPKTKGGIVNVIIKTDLAPYNFGIDDVAVSVIEKENQPGRSFSIGTNADTRFDFYTNKKPSNIENQEPNETYTLNITDKNKPVSEMMIPTAIAKPISFLAVFLNPDGKSFISNEIVPVVENTNIAEIIPQESFSGNTVEGYSFGYQLKPKSVGKTKLTITFNGFTKSFSVIVE